MSLPPPSQIVVQRDTATLVTTAVAAVLNLLSSLFVALVILGMVGESTKKMDRLMETVETGQKQAEKNHKMMQDNWRELDYQRKTIQRLNAILDAAEAKAKMKEKKTR